jgi:hypothetical protein
MHWGEFYHCPHAQEFIDVSLSLNTFSGIDFHLNGFPRASSETKFEPFPPPTEIHGPTAYPKPFRIYIGTILHILFVALFACGCQNCGMKGLSRVAVRSA